MTISLLENVGTYHNLVTGSKSFGIWHSTCICEQQ